MAIVVPILSTFDDKGVKNASRSIKSAEGGWAKSGATAKAAFVPALAVLGGMAAIGGKLAKNAAADAAGQAKLAKAMENSAGATQAQVAQTEAWITAQGRALGVADDQLRPALQTLAQATDSVTEAQKLAGLAMDVAASAGVPVATAAKAISKAYDGNGAALKKLVPGISAAAIKSKDFGKIQADTNKIVGGQAKTAADTAQGKWQTFMLTISELGESLGAVLLPAISAAMVPLQAFGDFAGQHTTTIAVLAGVVAGLAAAVVLVNIGMKLYTAGAAVVKAATVGWTAVQWLFNAAMTANPIGLVVLAIALFVAAIVVAYKKSETFRAVIAKAWAAIKVATAVAFGAIKAVISGVWGVVKGIFTVWAAEVHVVIAVFRALWGVVKTVASKIKGAWDTLWGFLSGIFDKITGAIDKVKGAFGGVLGFVGGLFGGGGDAAAAAPAGFAMMSAGLETALAPESLMSAPATGSATTTITVQGAVDPEGTARAIQRILSGHDQRIGRQSGSPRRLAW
jgi:phage-related protein